MMLRRIIAAISLGSIVLGSIAGCSFKVQENRKALDLSKAPTYSESKAKQEIAKEKNGITLATDGNTSYKILYEKNANEELKSAVSFLAETLQQMIGCGTIEIIEDGKADKGCFISIGNTQLSENINIDQIENDGYILKVKDNNLIIKGANQSGTKNGIYDFLETKLGCMFLRNDYDYIPEFPTIRLENYDEVINPSIAWRKQFQYEALQNNWYDKLKLNGTKAKEGFKEGIYAQWGTWCHTQFQFVPPEKYFDSHPEYFALINGKRCYQAKWHSSDMQTHLCLTNEDVYEIVKAGMKSEIQKNPEALYWDFSIMDTPVKVCQCPECNRINTKYQSNSATIIMFINRLAKDLGKEFPNLMFSTLAYQDCINPPVGLEVEQNVVIKLCANPGSQGYSYSVGANKNSKQIKLLLESWGNIAKNIVVWDYVVDFNHLLLPFPNYDVQKANMDFYVDNNVMGVFHQGSREKGDEMADMRTYLLSRQMWDKDIDFEALMKKYIQLNYGEASPYIEEYLETMSESYISHNKELNLYDNPSKHKYDYLSASNIAKYMQLTEKAMAAVQDDQMALEQVEKVRMCVLYAKCTESSLDIAGKKAAAEEMKIYTDKFGVTKYHEVMEIEKFYNDVFPGIIKRNKISISCVIASCILGVGLLVVIPFEIRKRKKKKKLLG
jgi:hypothetical protein